MNPLQLLTRLRLDRIAITRLARSADRICVDLERVKDWPGAKLHAAQSKDRAERYKRAVEHMEEAEREMKEAMR